MNTSRRAATSAAPCRRPGNHHRRTSNRVSSTAAPGASPGQGTRVLVVDDDPYITDLVATTLRYEGFDVSTVRSGREAMTIVDSFVPDLIVLDVMLPDVEGFEVQRRLADSGRRTPVLFLTARDATEDKVQGLSIGDDYLTKPFSLEELVARIRAILRRTHGPGSDERLRFADLEMDEATHEVRRGKKSIELTATEFKLLRYFLYNPRRVLSKSQIVNSVWNYDFGGDLSVVETYISYLRRKLDVAGPRLIHTIRGVGYVLRLPQS
jgi:two-component system OmpR family response regulator